MTRPVARRLFALIVSFGLVSSLAGPVAAVDGATYVALANQKRASVGLGPVGLHAAVDQIAVERANHMATHDDFRHDTTYIVNRLRQLGVCFTGYGEIIASERGYATYDPARTMEQWWASQGHHDIIVGNYSHAGGSHATSSATRTIYSAMVFVKLCAGSTAPPPPPADTDNTAISRLAGGDRYATAAEISRARFSSASTVFVATGTSFPDALAGAPAAAALKAPILLTAPTSLPAATAGELVRLRPSRIVVLGGPSAISDGVVNQLAGHASRVDRWWGADRFETAANVARAAFAPGVARVYLATGRSFPDALSGGAVAGLNGAPILLVERESIPAATAAALAALRPGAVVILGGSGVVSDAVASTASRFATTGSVQRLAGHDRFATSVAVSRSVYGAAGSDAAFVATGTTFPDGLAGGPVAALVPGPLLLVEPHRLPGTISAELQRLGPDRVFVLGGNGAVSDGVVGAIDAALP